MVFRNIPVKNPNQAFATLRQDFNKNVVSSLTNLEVEEQDEEEEEQEQEDEEENENEDEDENEDEEEDGKNSFDFNNASTLDKIKYYFEGNTDTDYNIDQRDIKSSKKKFFNIDFLPGSGYIFRKMIELIGQGTCIPIPLVIYEEGITINFSSKSTSNETNKKSSSDVIIFEIELHAEKIFTYECDVSKWNNGEKNGYETPCHGISLMNREFVSEITNIGKKEGYRIYGQINQNGEEVISGVNYGSVPSQPVDYNYVSYKPLEIVVDDGFKEGMKEVKIPILEFTEACDKFISKKKKNGIFLVTKNAVRFHSLEDHKCKELFCKIGTMKPPTSRFYDPDDEDKIYMVPVCESTVKMLSYLHHSCNGFVSLFTREDNYLRIKFSPTIAKVDSIIHIDNRNQ